tara:strand:- start:665 stop:1213 length:549 start_codon:yes stop_codon:yes gene_type:complete
MPRSRLNIVDFDDTLAWSSKAVAIMRRKHPDVQERDWWRDPNASTAAAEITKPIIGMWRMVANSPGDAIILTGRHHAPVLRWLSLHAAHPDVAPGIARITDVISTAGKGWPVEGTSARKALYTMNHCDQYDEVHIYDDHPDNLAAIQGMCPKVRLHQVIDGRLANPRGWAFHRRKGWDYPAT